MSKRLATVQRDVAVDFDIAAEAAREPDRSRLREVFREYELRDPLRRLEEALGDAELAAPAPDGDAEPHRARARGERWPASPAWGAPASELCVAVRASEPPEGALFADGRAVALRGGRRRARCWPATAPAPRRSSAACGERPVVAHDAKALGLVPATLAHDTLLGAYLLEPARRGYPLAELCEERGFASDLEDPRRRARR